MTIRILNLTQHKATQDQLEAGVVDLNEEDYKELCKLLTFDEIPNNTEMFVRVGRIIDMLDANSQEFDSVMIGGAPYFMSMLETELHYWGYNPVYAFSKREVIEKVDVDGNVRKVSNFKHMGFVTIYHEVMK